jgi:hypothetical protein
MVGGHGWGGDSKPLMQPLQRRQSIAHDMVYETNKVCRFQITSQYKNVSKSV